MPTGPNQQTGNDDIPSATITIGTVEINDHNAKYINDGPDTAVWTSYELRNRYEQDRHIYQMPIASPTGFNGGTSAFVQLAAPGLNWICDWSAARYGQPPIAPDPRPIDPQWILLDTHYESVMLILAADGVTPLYRLNGTYFYGRQNSNDLASDHIVFGRPPYQQDVFQRKFPSEFLQAGLAEISPVRGGGTLGGSAGAGGSAGTGGGSSFGGSTGGGSSVGAGGSFG